MPHERIPLEVGFHPEPRGSGPSWLIDDVGFVYLRCRCGLVLGGLKRHSIDADGVVNASVLHDSTSQLDATDCNWHTYVQLGDWADGAKAAGEDKYADSKLPNGSAP